MRGDVEALEELLGAETTRRRPTIANKERVRGAETERAVSLLARLDDDLTRYGLILFYIWGGRRGKIHAD